MAEAEEGCRGVVQACHVVAEGGLGFDVLCQRVSRVLLAIDVEEYHDLARDELLKEAHAPRDVGETFDRRGVIGSQQNGGFVVAPDANCLMPEDAKGNEGEDARDGEEYSTGHGGCEHFGGSRVDGG